jgi:internalin A
MLREKKHGHLTPAALRAILPEDRWPKQKHVNYVLALMEKFELCFPGEDGSVLVPDLLPDQTPLLTDWKAEECVVFLYHYPVLPHGVLPRFLTRTHALSEGRARWRSGVMLAGEGADALIKADYDANTVSIWVRGSHAQDRRALLAIVRGHFHAIHARIKDLNPTEHVAVPGHPDVTVPYQDLLQDERDNVKFTRVTIDGQRVAWKTTDLLDGVESEAKRKRERKKLDSLTGRRSVYIEKYYDMKDSRNLTIHGDVANSQVGQTLAQCTNNINAQSDGELKEALAVLVKEVGALIRQLPPDKKAREEDIAKDLEMVVEQATAEKPHRRWYEVSAQGLNEAAEWATGFAGRIGKALSAVTKLALNS